MSGLRDARLHKALECAPDQGELPRAQTRRAIQAHAHAAVKPEARAPWWKRLYNSTGGARQMPWNAAFATVAVATLVTLLWHHQEVPDSAGEPFESQPATTAPAAATPAAAPPAPTPVAAPAAPQARAQAADAAVATKPSDIRAKRPVPPPESAAPAREAALERSSNDSPSRQARREQTEGLAKEAKEAAPAADPVPMPAPALVQTMPAQSAAAPQARSARLQPSPTEAATTVRVAMQGRTFEAPLVRPSTLSQLMTRASRETGGIEPLHAPAELRIELQREGESLGVLELAGTQMRWAPAAGQTRTSTPDPALLQALREEIARLQGR